MSYEVIIIMENSSFPIEKTSIPFEMDIDGALFYTKKDKFLNITFSTQVESYYDEEEIQFIQNHFERYFFYVVDTNSFALLKLLVQNLSNKIEFLIDNDHGLILKPDDFMEYTSFSAFRLRQ
jgi:hypothetical protein